MNERLSSPGTIAHLDPEELALLLEGTLAADKAIVVRRHIAECEDCYEVFVTAADVLEAASGEISAEGILPHSLPADSAPAARRGFQPLAFAALAALAVLTGIMVYRQLPPPPQAGFALTQVIAPLENEDARLIGTPPKVRTAAAGIEDPQRLAFGLGVESVHLALQARAGDEAPARETLKVLQKLWGRLDRVDAAVSPFTGEPDTVVRQIEETRRLNVREFYFDRPYFELGVWTEASRLAAEGGRAEYFEGAPYRDTLAALIRDEPALAPGLRKIQRLSSLPERKAALQKFRKDNDPP